MLAVHLLAQGTATSLQAVRILAHQLAVSTGSSSPPALARMHLHSLLCTCYVGMLTAFKGSRSATGTLHCHAPPVAVAHLTG